MAMRSMPLSRPMISVKTGIVFCQIELVSALAYVTPSTLKY